jgi:hypothetical protein
MLLLLSGGAIAGCADRPTEPARTDPAAAAPATIATTIMTPALELVLHDAAGRLTSGLTNADDRQRLRSMFAALDAHIQAGDAGLAAAQISFVRRELLTESSASDAADRDAIAFSLDQIQRSLVAPSAAR